VYILHSVAEANNLLHLNNIHFYIFWFKSISDECNLYLSCKHHQRCSAAAAVGVCVFYDNRTRGPSKLTNTKSLRREIRELAADVDPSEILLDRSTAHTHTQQ